MSNITTIYSSGLDALANLFEVQLDLDGSIGDFFDDSIKDEIVFRIQNFTVPSSETNTYEINWGPWSFERPSGKINKANEVSFTIRLDRNYAVYQGFVNWKNAIQNEYTGVTSDLRNLTTDITVYPVTSTIGASGDYVLSTVGVGVKFEYVWIKTVGDISYDQGSGDPLTVDVTFGFLRFKKDFHTPSGDVENIGAKSADDSN